MRWIRMNGLGCDAWTSICHVKHISIVFFSLTLLLLFSNDFFFLFLCVFCSFFIFTNSYALCLQESGGCTQKKKRKKKKKIKLLKYIWLLVSFPFHHFISFVFFCFLALRFFCCRVTCARWLARVYSLLFIFWLFFTSFAAHSSLLILSVSIHSRNRSENGNQWAQFSELSSS